MQKNLKKPLSIPTILGKFITQLSKKYNVTHSTIYKSIDL